MQDVNFQAVAFSVTALFLGVSMAINPFFIPPITLPQGNPSSGPTQTATTPIGGVFIGQDSDANADTWRMMPFGVGTYEIHAGSTAATVEHDATTSELQTALNTIFGSALVTVSGSAGDYTLTDTDNGGANITLITVSENGLLVSPAWWFEARLALGGGA